MPTWKNVGSYFAPTEKHPVDWDDFPTSPNVIIELEKLSKTEENKDYISIASEYLSSDDYDLDEKAQVARDIGISLKNRVDKNSVQEAISVIEKEKETRRAAYWDDKKFWRVALYFVGFGILFIIILSAALSYFA